ncbi:hypothetical protein PSSY5922_27275 [Pseudomonas synxantha]
MSVVLLEIKRQAAAYVRLRAGRIGQPAPIAIGGIQRRTACVIDEVARSTQDHRVAAAFAGNAACVADHHIRLARTGDHMPGRTGVLQGTVDLDAAIEQGQAVVGLEAEPAVVHGRGAGAVQPANGQVHDVVELAQRIGRRNAVAAIQGDIGGDVPGLQPEAGGRHILQRGLGEIDIGRTQGQCVVAGIELDVAGEVNVAVGVNRCTTEHGQRRREVDVTIEGELAAQALFTCRTAQPFGPHRIAEVQPPRAEGYIARERGNAFRVVGCTKRQIQIAAGRVDWRVDGQRPAPTRVRVAGQPHITAMGADGAGDGQAVGAEERDTACAGNPAADIPDIMRRQVSERRVGPRAVRNQVERVFDRA